MLSDKGKQQKYAVLVHTLYISVLLGIKLKVWCGPFKRTDNTPKHFLFASVSKAFNRTGANDGGVLKGIL